MEHSRRSRRSTSYSSRRSRSPRRPSNRETRGRRHDSSARGRHAGLRPPSLPFGAAPLSKHSFARYEPMFGLYLDIQKGINIAELSEREIKGRWKSFMGKWNRGELAEGWYDPKTLEKAQDNAFARGRSESREPNNRSVQSRIRQRSPSRDRYSRSASRRDEQHDTKRARLSEPLPHEEEYSDDDEDESSYGPKIPIEKTAISTHHEPRRGDKSGPKIPTIQDLQFQKELQHASTQESHEVQRLTHKQSLKSHKAELRQIEDEVAPRAEPGTRERRLEKRSQAASANRAFAESRRGQSPGEAPETELMGGEGELETLKREREKEVHKKNERELRKEEILRARAAEREERLRTYREKEEKTMSYLRTLAKEKFG